eukprot:UN01104
MVSCIFIIIFIVTILECLHWRKLYDDELKKINSHPKKLLNLQHQ